MRVRGNYQVRRTVVLYFAGRFVTEYVLGSECQTQGGGYNGDAFIYTKTWMETGGCGRVTGW